MGPAKKLITLNLVNNILAPISNFPLICCAYTNYKFGTCLNQNNQKSYSLELNNLFFNCLKYNKQQIGCFLITFNRYLTPTKNIIKYPDSLLES